MSAVVLAPLRPDATAPGYRFDSGQQATVRWTYPAGHTGTARIEPAHPVLAGGALPVWVTEDGRLGASPPTTAGLAVLAVGIGTGSWLLLSAAILTGYTLRRRALERRALRDWGAGWAAVEPHWSGRLRGRPGNTAP